MFATMMVGEWTSSRRRLMVSMFATMVGESDVRDDVGKC